MNTKRGLPKINPSLEVASVAFVVYDSIEVTPVSVEARRTNGYVFVTSSPARISVTGVLVMLDKFMPSAARPDVGVALVYEIAVMDAPVVAAAC